jgi:hypothetical protein
MEDGSQLQSVLQHLLRQMICQLKILLTNGKLLLWNPKIWFSPTFSTTTMLQHPAAPIAKFIFLHLTKDIFHSLSEVSTAKIVFLIWASLGRGTGRILTRNGSRT